MNVSIDKFGRLVLPKTVRGHFGLVAGSELTLEECEDKIILRLIDERTTLHLDDGILVFNGKLNGNIEQIFTEFREERFNHLSGL
jgi:AbrB family looped-hinge helix DNA binding protein